MKRVFIAVDIPASKELKEVYELARYRMRLERINWVALDRLHVTLTFLGDTEENIMPDIVQSIENALSGKRTFEITLRSFGVFKDLHDPRVIWLGCDPSVNLQDIKQDLDKNLSLLGFTVETRAFSPHLTLGRIKGIRQVNQLAQLVSMYKNVEIQRQQIDYIVLYESRLTLQGPEYIPIQKFVF